MNLTILNFKNSPVRVVSIDGEPWWVAKDVCDILGLGNPAQATRSFDEDEKGISQIDTPGGTQGLTVISESGLLRLMARSDKPEARPFQRWVFREVLPSILKTGSYSAPNAQPGPETIEVMRAVAQNLTALTNRAVEVDARLTAVEQRQRDVDPLAIERRMRFLDQCKSLLVFGTKGKPQAVTFRSYWHALKEQIGIASFQNRAALSVPMMDKAIAYAIEWCHTRGVEPPAIASVTDAQSA